jgi:hypothetical protein
MELNLVFHLEVLFEMDNIKELKAYLKEAKKRGFSYEEAKGKALKQGYSSKDYDNAVSSLKRNKIIGIGAIVIVILLLVFAGYLYIQNQKVYSGENYELSPGEIKEITFSGEQHSLTVNDVEGDSATITIQSTPQTLTLNVGQTKEVVLDSGTVSVTLISITNEKAIINVKDNSIITGSSRGTSGGSSRTGTTDTTATTDATTDATTSAPAAISKGGGGGGGSSGGNTGGGKKESYVEYCSDSDNVNGTTSLTNQTLIEGNVIYAIDSCQGNLSASCFVAISSADVCLSNVILIEQGCDKKNNILQTQVSCAKGCSGGKCLRGQSESL